MTQLLAMLVAIVGSLATGIDAFAEEQNEVPRARFGFSTKYLDDPEKGTGRLLIDRLAPEGPAARSGLRLGDQIVAFDGQAFRFENDAAAFRGMARFAPGRALRVTVIRGGAEMDFTMTPEAASPEQIARNVEWLRQTEATGSRACSGGDDLHDLCILEIRKRVEAAGGRAVILIERLSGEPGAPPTYSATSEEIELPTGFDWRDHWPMQAYLINTMRIGEKFPIEIRIEEDGHTHVGPLLEGTRWESLLHGGS